MISAISLATIGSIELLLLIESASVDELIVLIGASFAEYILSSISASTLDRPVSYTHLTLPTNREV